MPSYLWLLRKSIVPADETRLAQYSKVLASLTTMLPRILGSGAKGIVLIASRKYGRSIISGGALGGKASFRCLLEELSRNSSWSVEVYGKDRGSAGVYLLVRECPIRQVCAFEGLEIGGLPCFMTKGVLEGFIEKFTGLAVSVNTVQTGPNACLYSCSPRGGGSISSEPFKIYDLVRRGEEYVDLVRKDLRGLMISLTETVEKGAGSGALPVLRFSNRRYGSLRAGLYPEARDLAEAVNYLSQEIMLDVRLEKDSTLVITDCPFSELNSDVICRSLSGFIEGFLSSSAGVRVRVFKQVRGNPCSIKLKV